MKTILMTGAAGGVARMLRPLMRADYRLRLSDRAPLQGLAPGEEQAPADLADFDAVLRAVKGVDGVLHLGGFSVEGTWPQIHEANIVGAYNVFEAARQAGVKRLIFASSNHAVGFYRRDQTIGHDVTPRPDSRYGVSKAFGEALAGLYAYKYGVEVTSIRIGNVETKPLDARRLAIWISPRDLYQLVRIGLERPGIVHEIVYGVSKSSRSWWDNSNAARLGYKPQDNADDYAADVLAKHSPISGDVRADTHQGGPFCTSESGGDPVKQI
jgi:uronate dehydrogenase